MICLNRIALLFVVIYLITILIFYSLLQKQQQNPNSKYLKTQQNDLTNDITCLILEFENFDNNLLDTVNDLCGVFSKVVIYSETVIYPPIIFSNNNNSSNCDISVIEKWRINSRNTFADYNWLSVIKSRYLIIFPDSARIRNEYYDRSLSSHLIDLLFKSNVDGLLFSVFLQQHEFSRRIEWQNISFDVKRWTLSLPHFINSNDLINLNDIVLFMKTEHISKFVRPFCRPVILSSIIQSHIANVKLNQSFQKIFFKENKLFLTERSKKKQLQYFNYRLDQLYNELAVKKVIYLNNSIEWHGCDRNKARCFGTIIDNVPEYLALDRWLPPCCLRNLQITGRYVLNLLEKLGIRYWLEGGTLLGAARNGQIIEWDYDIDLGIYREDSVKFNILSKLLESDPGYQIEDGQGFVWQKALEGDFIKVHFSAINRIHVDLFPFVSINDTMTKDTWFSDHPQDVPFPEYFLKPMTRIPFIGLNVSVPNNIRQFLELKFGQGVIETPKYPTNEIVYEYNYK